MEQSVMSGENLRCAMLIQRGDPLAKVNQLIDWEMFRSPIEPALKNEAKNPLDANQQLVEARTNAEIAKENAQKARDNLVNLHIGIGSEKSKSETRSTTTVAEGSTVKAKGDVTITSTKEDINIHGSSVEGENITLNAAKDLNVTASENTNKTKEDHTASSGSIGVTVGLGGAMGVDAGYSRGKENIKENGTIYNESTVTAKKDPTFESGKDTNIRGGALSGEKVTGKVGGDLNIESKKDSKDYESKSGSSGLGVDEYKGNTSQKPGETDITQAARDNVAESLNPFIDPSTGKPTTTGGANAKDTMTLPDNAIYHVNDDSTSKYLVETDPAFTNKHNFLSSDYMYEQMKWNPDKVAKRLGDGFYEQDFIRQQITSLTGMRYLDGYGSEEEEYKALMDAGVAYAKEQGLTPGIALTKEQVASLTSDIVWLETTTVHVNGKDVSVIYPHVYLRANGDMTLSKDGSLISGKSLVIDTKKEIKNAGSLYGNTVIAKGDSITNTGRIEGKTVDLSAIHDIHQKGLILGGSQASLSAGGNIDMGSTVEHGKNQDILDTTAGIAVKDKDGVLLMSAGKDLHLTGATLGNLGEKGSTILQAGGNVTMDTDKLTARKDMTENSDNYIRTYRSTETANTILGTGDITIGAGNNASLRNTSVTSGEGKVTVTAGNDVSITNGETESRDEYGIKYKESGFLSSKTTTIKSDDYHKGVTGSLLSGNEVTIQSGKDTNITASTVVSQKDTSITAGGNVNIDTAQQIDKNQYEKQVKKSGLLGGGGLGFTIGSEKRKDTYAGRDTTQIGSTVGSVEGNVNISAHKEIDVKASDLVAGKDVNLTGENVNISSKDNIYHNEEKHEYKRSGLSVSVGGGVVSAVSGAVANIQRGAEVRDNKLKALYGVETYQAIAKNKDMLQDIKGKGMPSISVGMGSSSYASNSTTETTEARGSTVTAGNDVNITTKKDIQIHGSDVVGKDVTLKAGEDIKITAATQTSTNTTNQSSKSGSIGVTFSPTGNGIYANASKGSGHENETIITHRGSAVAAGSMLTMESGKDTDITGSKAGGNKVTVNAGGNLHVESERDKDIYTEKTTNKGVGIGADTSGQGAGSMGLSGGNTRGDTHSNYESVTSQAGIYAGNEGFDINVKGNTDLKGAVIDSHAPSEKNTLTTGTLTWEDIGNNADYKAGTSGTSYQTGSAGGKTTGGMTPVRTQDVKDKASSTTKSAISDGTVTITNQKGQKQDIGSINRDTKDSLNKLAQIFDKEDVKERQELVNTFSQVMNEKIGDIAAEKGWAPDDPRRAGLHALAGGFTAAMGGGNALSGAAGAGVMESLQPVLDQFVKDHPDMREAVSVLIGSTVGKLTGDTNAGEAAAWSSTKFNWLTHEQYEEYMSERNAAKTDKEQADVDQRWRVINDRQKSKAWIASQTDGAYYDPFIGPLPSVMLIAPRPIQFNKNSAGESLTMNALSDAINNPWERIAKSHNGWKANIVKFGAIGGVVTGGISAYEDYHQYSGGDLALAWGYDALGVGASVGMSAFLPELPPPISAVTGVGIDYTVYLAKYHTLTTDKEKAYLERRHEK